MAEALAEDAADASTPVTKLRADPVLGNADTKTEVATLRLREAALERPVGVGAAGRSVDATPVLARTVSWPPSRVATVCDCEANIELTSGPTGEGSTHQGKRDGWVDVI